MATDYERIRERFLAHPIHVDGRRYYVAERDLLLDETQLTDYLQRYVTAHRRPQEAPPEHSFVDRGRRLLARTRGGRVLRWRDGLVLTYSVDGASFADHHQEVVANMRDAAGAWQDVCGIRFERASTADDHSSNRSALTMFTVMGADLGGQAYAVAFFPDDPPDRRTIMIDSSYFAPSLPFDPVGVLRHELGHVLGFRHEHIRGGPWVDCAPEELEETRALTDYDPKSVMHYLCQGLGSPSLELTEVDIEGARQVYGPSFELFELVG